MHRLEDILNHNKEFTQNKEYIPFQAKRISDHKIVVVSCMDTRLTELLPRAMNLKAGDAKFIKDAGAIVSHPFGSVMRSVIVAIYELKADMVVVVGHHDCGMSSINPDSTLEKMKTRGISDDTINTLKNSGIKLEDWLHGFDNVEDSVRGSVEIIRNHPLVPKDVPVHGLVIDPETGRLDIVVTDTFEDIE
ncbi:MAG: beta-class carbonic anhydrase [Tumebacillaceae bacterium]